MDDTTLTTLNYNIIADKLDSLMLQNHQNFNELSKAIIATNNDNKLFGFFSFDTIITVFITLGIFIFGEYLRSRSIRRKSIEQQRQLRKSIKLTLEKLIPYIHSIETSFIDYFKDTSVDTGLYTLPLITYKYDFKIIVNSDIRELHNAFAEKNIIQNICSQTDSILAIILISESYHDKMLNSINQIGEELIILQSQYLELVNDYLDEMRLKYANSLLQIEPYQIISGLMFSYYFDYLETRKISIFKTVLLNPMTSYIIDKKLFRDNEKANRLTYTAKEFSNQYFEMDLRITAYKNQFINYSDEIKELKNLIIDNMGKINWE